MASFPLETNPWRTKSQHIAYENPWIRVNHHEVIHPDGSDGIYGVVEFKNVAVGVLPIDDEGNIYLVGQYRFPLKKYSWEIPEGGSPEGESELDTAKRELKEELGIIADEWLPLCCNIQLSNSVTNETGAIFIARSLHLVQNCPESSEALMAKKVPFQEALEMVLSGEICDSLSVIGILAYSHHYV